VTGKKAAYFFCVAEGGDPVAPGVLAAVQRLFAPEDAGYQADGRPVLRSADARGNEFHFVGIDRVLSHDYDRYLPLLNSRFGDFDIAGVVNWHGGANAPDRVLTVHSTGDVVSGHYGAANPILMRNLLLALERHRQAAALQEFTVTTEATHWSGIPQGSDPALIPRYGVPVVDVEIGSTPESWSNVSAAETVARALLDVFTGGDPDPALRSLFCVGGIHLEPSFAAGVLGSAPERPLAVSHILPNHWLGAGQYDADAAGLDKFRAAVRTIAGGIHGIVFHEDLKGKFKQQLRVLGEELGVPVVKRQALKTPSELPLW
jgi:D-tyrosyl-tRNA(Tyr) deacylase